MKVRCPVCSKQVEWSAASVFRPFCSERCSLIDLGAWASEDYRVAGEELALDQMSNVAEMSEKP